MVSCLASKWRQFSTSANIRDPSENAEMAKKQLMILQGADKPLRIIELGDVKSRV